MIVVKTNVSYQVVGTFITSSETTEAISEGLKLIKAWNEGWSPLYWMTDFCTAEINAIEVTFKGENRTLYVISKRWVL